MGKTKQTVRHGSSGIRAVLEGIRDLLFPLRCPVCDRIVKPRGERICTGCLGSLEPVRAPWCMICGRHMADEGDLCRECREAGRHSFRRARALYDYRSVRAGIYRFKYGNRQEYGEFYGREMAAYLGDFILGVQPQGLIPVPLHRRRQAKRGYNQAAVLARVIGRELGLPVYENILFRVRNTAPLKNQNPKERQNNLKKAFLVRQNDVKLKTIVLIDDIYTTGATADEAAAALLESGIEEVYVATLAGSEEW